MLGFGGLCDGSDGSDGLGYVLLIELIFGVSEGW